MKRLYRCCATLGTLALLTANIFCRGHDGVSQSLDSLDSVNAVDVDYRRSQYQEKMKRAEAVGEPKTITRVIFVGGSDTTHAVRQSMCVPENIGPYESLAGSSSQSEVQRDTAVYGWAKMLVKPVFLAKTMLAAAFTLILKPAWLVAAWVARVLLFRPAVFIYLLFLEKPFQALLSFVLWILPLLAFVTAVTLVAILIGGSFGWISAVAVGIIDTSTKTGSQQQIDDRSSSSTTDSGPQRIELLFEQPYKGDSSGAPLSDPPEMWSRRRRTKPAL